MYSGWSWNDHYDLSCDRPDGFIGQCDNREALCIERPGLYGRGTWEHGLHCPEDMDLLESGTYTNTDFKEAEHDINSTAIIPAPLTMKYRAGHEVRLEPGFHASGESKFHAFIHPCDAPGNSFTPKNVTSSLGTSGNDQESDQAFLGQLTIYPNPTSGSFIVELPYLEEKATYNLIIMDAMGRTVFFTSLANERVMVNFQGQRGLYLIVVEGYGNHWTERLIVE